MPSLFPEPPEAPKGPFNFSDAMHALMADVAAVCEELRHIDMSRVAVAVSQARHGRLDGVSATVHPMRFEGGTRESVIRGRRCVMPGLTVDGREMLYVVTYRLPRFCNLPFEENLPVVVHEMYHISPAFDGDLRRFPGGKPYHTGSKAKYDAVMARIAKRYLEQTQHPELHAFLRPSFRELSERHGGVGGFEIRRIRPRYVE